MRIILNKSGRLLLNPRLGNTIKKYIIINNIYIYIVYKCISIDILLCISIFYYVISFFVFTLIRQSVYTQCIFYYSNTFEGYLRGATFRWWWCSQLVVVRASSLQSVGWSVGREAVGCGSCRVGYRVSQVCLSFVRQGVRGWLGTVSEWVWSGTGHVLGMGLRMVRILIGWQELGDLSFTHRVRAPQLDKYKIKCYMSVKLGGCVIPLCVLT